MAATEEHTKKRKVQDDDKPRKKQKKQKKVREDEGDLDVEAGLNRAFERMDGQLAADYIAQKTRRFGTDLSPVELSDLYISGECLLWVLVVVGRAMG
jgi:protein CMS1